MALRPANQTPPTPGWWRVASRRESKDDAAGIWFVLAEDVTPAQGAATGDRSFGGSHRRPARLQIVPWTNLLALAAYAGLSLATTWPLVTRFTTYVVGTDVDEGSFLWNLWWVRFAVLDLHVSPYWSDWIFYPVGVNLATYTLTPINALLTLPIQLVAGPIVANNVVLILSLTFSGFGSYLLALETLRPRVDQSEIAEPGRPASFRAPELAAFVGGLVYAFPASRFIYATLGQANFTSTAWLPFFALFFIRVLRPFGRPVRSVFLNGMLAGLCFAGAALTELTYAEFLAILAAFLAVGEVRSNIRPGVGGDLVPRLSVGKLVVGFFGLVAGASPLLPALILFAKDSVVSSTGWGEADRFSADLLSLLTPTRLNPLLGGLSRDWSSDFRDMPIEFLGWTTAAAAIAGAVFIWQRNLIWAVSATGFLLLSLGPILHVSGRNSFDLDGLIVRFPLPFLILHYLPFVGANRVPNRFSVMVMLCLAVLVAGGVAWLVTKFGKRLWIRSVFALLVASGLLLEHWSAPLPLRDATPPVPYVRLGQEPGDFAILQLPLGWRNSFGIQGSEKTILQSYQAVHRKRLLGGNTSRNPDSTFAYYRRIPVVRTIIQLEEGKPAAPGAVDADRSAAPDLVELYDLRYVVVQRSMTPPFAEEYLLSVLDLDQPSIDGDTAVYRIRRTAQSLPRRYDLGTTRGEVILGAGWGANEQGAGDISLVWATQRNVEMFVPGIPAAGILRLRLTPFVYGGMPEQTVRVTVNGTEVGPSQVLNPGWTDIEVKLPAGILRSGANRVGILFSALASPADVLGSTDRRSLAAAVDWVEIGSSG